MLRKLTPIEATLRAFKELDPRALTGALCNEVRLARLSIPKEARQRMPADQLQKLLRAYLGGKISVEECAARRQALIDQLPARPMGLNREAQALLSYQWACAHIPLTSEAWHDAYDVISELQDFYSHWNTDWNGSIDWDKLRKKQLLRLQAALEKNAWQAPAIVIPTGRDRISGLAR